MPKTITLSRDGVVFATVDSELHGIITQFNSWCMKPGRRTTYARTHHTIDGERVPIFMHRLVLCVAGIQQPGGGKIVGDHIDGNGLNNQLHNLRWLTIKENASNVSSLQQRQQQLTLNERVSRARQVLSTISRSLKLPDVLVRYRQLSLGCLEPFPSLTNERAPLPSLPHTHAPTGEVVEDSEFLSTF